MQNKILTAIALLVLGALGALVFNIFVFPYLLTNPYFANFQFVKDFKEGKIVVNQTQQVHVQENTALQSGIINAKNSVVSISGKTLGAGFIATSDGSVVTLANLVPASGSFKVILAGQSVSFQVVTVDYRNNLALLKIDQSNLQTVAFADTTGITLGQRLFLAAPTSPVQDNWLADEGMVREIDPVAGDPSQIQTIKTTITEKPLVAGSPVFNVSGQVMGLAVVGADGTISLIPSSKIQTLLGL